MDNVLRVFHIEATELLEDMEAALLRLEKSPQDAEALNSVFRAAHTIKGSAGIIGEENIEAFTHVVENLLEQLRSGLINVSEEIVELLLGCKDHVSHMLAGVLDNTPLEESVLETGKRLLSDLAAITGALETTGTALETGSGGDVHEMKDVARGPRASTPNWHISLRFGPDTLRNGMDPISFISYLQKLGDTVFLKTLWDSMPPADQMDPESCYLGFEIDIASNSSQDEIEDVFEFLQDDCTLTVLPPHSPVADYIHLIRTLPEDNVMLGQVLVQGGALAPEDISQNIAEIMDINQSESQATRAEASSNVSQNISSAQKSSIRVDTSKLDRLINTVGELVISGAALKQEADSLNSQRLHEITNVLMRLIGDVRDSSMSARMTPLWETFNRFKRMVRDICHDKSKEIELQITGGDTELDRNMIERIKDPLVHLVRNAADHGIEPPQERILAGKPSKGMVTLSARQDTGDIVIEVSDDGRGLNRDTLIAKAIAKGLIDENHTLSDDEVLALIFEPGLSTATEITNISGRGVGMDVVKRNIEALRGSVSLESAEGQGTKVHVRLPLTLAIIDTFLVTIGDTSFVIPMDMVEEVLELTDLHRQESHGRDHINLRGHILPYINLHKMFDIDNSRTQVQHILVARHSGKSVGLLVDNLLGEVQTVIKSLGRYYRDVRGISGATILGNGTVALILDIPALVKQATKQAN